MTERTFITGTDGDDILRLDGTDPHIDGGLGYDTVDITGHMAHTLLRSDVNGGFYLDYDDQTSGDSYNATLTSVERLMFTDGSGIEIGSASDGRIGVESVGYAGLDIDWSGFENSQSYEIRGGSYADSVRLGAGSDVVYAGWGDTVDTGLGTDTVYVNDYRSNTVSETGASETTHIYDASDMSKSVSVTGAENIVYKTAAMDADGDDYADVFWAGPDGSMAIWKMQNHVVQQVSVVQPQVPFGAGDKVIGTADFDGDGRTDFVVRSGSSIASVSASGTVAPVADLAAAGLGAAWEVAAIGDFGGDGKDDLFLRNHLTGESMTVANGDMAARADQGIVDARDWAVEGTGDLDGDGDQDILWRNTQTGTVNAWMMEDGTRVSAEDIYTVSDMGWEIEGTGDFNGDGKDDILLKHDNGSVNVWTMDGATIVKGQDAGSTAAGWDVKAIADYDRDGDADILWHKPTGETVTWVMENGAFVSAGGTGQAGTDWSVAELEDMSHEAAMVPSKGDIDGDGIGEIILQHPIGYVGSWSVENGLSGAFIPVTLEAGESIVAHGDFDGDGDVDLMTTDSDNAYLARQWASDGTGNYVASVVGEAWTGLDAVGTGDFNGDGDDEVLWQHADGRVYVKDGQMTTLYSAQADKVAAIGDFDGDGNDDFVVQTDVSNFTGAFFMGSADDGSKFIMDAHAGFSNTEIVAAGDFNADGSDELLLRNSDGFSFAQVGSDGTLSAASWIGRPDNFSTVVVEDVLEATGDGRDDIVMRDTSTGDVFMWSPDEGGAFANTSIANIAAEWDIVA